jgi:MoaA/NifB/PqqE/SkfB family radical SAM enzyme
MRNALAAGLQVLSGRLRGQPALVGASLYLTQRCNLRCTYCSSPLRRTPELSTAQWRTIIAELAELGCRRLTILGGEPLLRADLGELIAYSRARGMRNVLTSNGLLVPRRIDALRGLDTLILSLDAPGPANDAVRGEGGFEAVEAAIAAAKAAGLRLKLNAVMSAVTAPHLDALLAFVERHDLYLTVNVVRSGAPDLWKDAATIKPDDAAISRLCERLAEVARTNRRLLFSPATYQYGAAWGDYSRDRYEADELPADDPRLRRGPSCQAGRAYVSIDADGMVYPCVVTMHRIAGGNAATDGVGAAWRKLNDHQCVACYTSCLVEQNFLHSLQPSVVAHFARRHLMRFA